MAGMQFDAASVQLIADVVRQVLAEDRSRVRRGDFHDFVQCTMLAKNGGSTIAARSGTTPGSGTVTLYSCDSTTLTALTGGSSTVTAYNLSGTAVAANAYIMVIRIGNKWWVMFEDCT